MLAALFGLSGVACDLQDAEREAAVRGSNNFQTAVSSPREGYDIYWLGPSFEAGGLTFTGPEVSDFGTDVEGGLQTNYLDPTKRLDITIISMNTIEGARSTDSLKSLPQRAEATIRDETIAGHPAIFMTRPGVLGRPVGALIAIVDFGDTIVEAQVGAVGPETPGGPEAHPLIDEATFLAVLEQLRPYPE